RRRASPPALPGRHLRRQRDGAAGDRGTHPCSSGPLPSLMNETAHDDSKDPQTDAPAVDQLRRELDEKQDRLLRARAEMDNMRRRAQRDREDYTRYATESLIRDLVPVLDNFDRALEAARGSVEAAKVVEGVELIQRELLRVLERAGVKRYSALGQPFDP